MPVTLAQAKVGMADHVDQQVIDNFRRGSQLLDALTFDNCVSPGTGGSTLTYGYTQLKTPATAAFRELNAEYTPKEADREKKTVELKIFGGSFQVDRFWRTPRMARSTKCSSSCRRRSTRRSTCSTTPPSTVTRAPQVLTVWTRCSWTPRPS